MICNAVIDTNVLVSALLSSNADAATVQVIAKIFSGEITPIISPATIDEYTIVLYRKKLKIRKEYADYIIRSITKFGTMIQPESSGVLLPDKTDIPFYDLAVTSNKNIGNTYLVTGNLRHFPNEPLIVSPRQLIDML